MKYCRECGKYVETDVDRTYDDGNGSDKTAVHCIECGAVLELRQETY